MRADAPMRISMRDCARDSRLNIDPPRETLGANAAIAAAVAHRDLDCRWRKPGRQLDLVIHGLVVAEADRTLGCATGALHSGGRAVQLAGDAYAHITVDRDVRLAALHERQMRHELSGRLPRRDAQLLYLQ